MIETPIYDELRMALPSSVFWWPDRIPCPRLCPICGDVCTPSPVDEYPEGICAECFECNRHVEPDAWHCADCGQFLRAFERFVVVQRNDAAPTFHCVEHGQLRMQLDSIVDDEIERWSTLLERLSD